MSSGRLWPYAIGGSILIIFGACVGTVIIAQTLPVEKSDTYMMEYHDADANANKLIKERIAFDKKYKVKYVTDGLSLEKSIIQYKLTDLDGNAVNSADITVVVTRPNKHKYNQELRNPSIENGVYTFPAITLPKEGRWDVMAKVNIDNLQRFYNVKADTRVKEAFEY